MTIENQYRLYNFFKDSGQTDRAEELDNVYNFSETKEKAHKYNKEFNDSVRPATSKTTKTSKGE